MVVSNLCDQFHDTVQVDDFNKFLTMVVGHFSMRKMWRYFVNSRIVIPLEEVTVDTCCFGR